MGYKLELRPAYGRKVENLEELKTMWNNGKDFIMVVAGKAGVYTSVRDFDMFRGDFDYITLRGTNKANSAVFETPIYTHPLAGVTTYI